MTRDPSPEWDTSATVSGELVTVERALERRDGGVIATLSVSAAGEDPVEVRIVERIPEGWPVDEVGLHPEYEPPGFMADADTIVIEGAVEPDDVFEVVYGVRLGETDEALEPPESPVLDEESVSSAETLWGPEGGFLAGDGSGSGAVDPFTFSGTPNGESGPEIGGVDEESPFGDPDEAFDEPAGAIGDDGSFSDPFDLTGDEPEAEPVDAGAKEADPGRDPGSQEIDIGAFVSRLADELQSGSIPEEDVAALREALRAEIPKSLEARIEHVNSRVEEVAAYSPFIRDLIDKHGSAAAFLEHLEDLRDEVQAAREDQHEAAAERRDLGEAIEGLDRDVSSMEEQVATQLDEVQADLDAVRERVDDVEGIEDRLVDELDGIRSEMASIESSLEQWRETRNALAATFRDASSDLSSTSLD